MENQLVREALELGLAALKYERDCIRQSCCVPKSDEQEIDKRYPLETMDDEMRPEYDRHVEVIAKVETAIKSLSDASPPGGRDAAA